MTTATDIVNQAIQLIGNNQAPVTGTAPNFDDSTAGKAAKNLYAPCVATVQRQFGWDFSRRTVTLVLTGNTAPAPWTYEYGYPSNGIELWDLFPASEDPNDPLPYNFNVGNALVSAVQQRVIWTDLQNALAIYNNNPNENTWDATFRETVVRLLASELAAAIAMKPDLSQTLQESYGVFEQIGEARQD